MQATTVCHRWRTKASLVTVVPARLRRRNRTRPPGSSFCESGGYHQKSLKLETSYHATPISSPLTLIAANANNPSIRLIGSSIPPL